MSLQRVAVLVSAGKHPVSGEPRHCRNDSLALAMGLSLAKEMSSFQRKLESIVDPTKKLDSSLRWNDGERVLNHLTVLHAGEAENPALQDYLALGAHHIDVVSASGDMVENLATQLQNVDLILTGTRAENGEDSGLLPYLLAAKLNLPLVAGALEITPHDNQLDILQFLPKGQRRRVRVQLPAVVVVHPLASAELHYVHARQVSGSVTAHPASNSAAHRTQWRTEAPRKPIKLQAPLVQTGHERLMAAITSKNKGGTVVNDGNCVEKAQVILNFLREHRLIDY